MKLYLASTLKCSGWVFQCLGVGDAGFGTQAFLGLRLVSATRVFDAPHVFHSRKSLEGLLHPIEDLGFRV